MCCMYVVYKNKGETPLRCLRRLCTDSQRTYTYAGRLDPMAEGLLLILVDDECKRARSAHRLNKMYEFEFIVGLSTDTYDCLGRITDCSAVCDDAPQQVTRAIERLQVL